MAERLVFAHQLRGVAALSVVVSHLVGVFWALRDFVALATSTPVQSGPNPALFDVINHAWFQNGPFGVALFFLISGLVIPISLERITAGRFVLARLLRIYPTYVVALLLEVAVLHASAAYWGKPFPYSDFAILANALLIHNAVGQPSIDLVNWTLCVELKFYLLMALVARPIRRGSILAVFAIAAGILAVLAAVSGSFGARLVAEHPALTSFVGTELPMIVFMLIGVLFNFRLRGLLSRPGFLASIAAMTGLFVACCMESELRPQFPAVTVNYLYAIALFGSLFAVRRHVQDNRILDALAAVSYPLYLVHCILGMVILKIGMLVLNLPYLVALAIAVAGSLAVAWGLHATVERWSIRAGHVITRQRPNSTSNPPESRLTRKYRGSTSEVA